jgi:hypothetical protein
MKQLIVDWYNVDTIYCPICDRMKKRAGCWYFEGTGKVPQLVLTVKHEQAEEEGERN